MSESQRLSMPTFDRELPAPRRRTRTGWERWQDGSWVTCAAPVFRDPATPPRVPMAPRQLYVKCRKGHDAWRTTSWGRECVECRQASRVTQRANELERRRREGRRAA